MTRVDFYVLPGSTSGDRIDYACRLAQKGYRLGHRIYIHAEDAAQAAEIDDALWAFRPDSFIPHRRLDEPQQPAAPIEIGFGNDPQDHQDLLINFAHQIPDFFSRFERVFEIVTQAPQVLESSRQRFSFYKQRGYTTRNHDLRK